MRPLMLRHSLWDLFGILSYRLVFAAFESLLVLFILVLLCVILPARWLRDRFAAEGSMIALLTSLWIVAFQLGSGIFRRWSLWPFLVALGYVAVISVLYALIAQNERIEKAIVSFIERLTIFSYVYLFLTAIGLLVVVFRNLAL
jgi:hypothetical protein